MNNHKNSTNLFLLLMELLVFWLSPELSLSSNKVASLVQLFSFTLPMLGGLGGRVSVEVFLGGRVSVEVFLVLAVPLFSEPALVLMKISMNTDNGCCVYIL